MKLIKEYLCDKSTPSDDEIKDCLKIAKEEDCIVKLIWHFPYSGQYERYIKKDMTFEEVNDSLPIIYGI